MSTVPEASPLPWELVTLPEIAFMTGFKRGTVERWRLRTTKDEEPIFIEPDDYIGSTPVWRLCRVTAWLDDTNRTYDVELWRKTRADGGFRRRPTDLG